MLQNEQERLEVLRRYEILDTPPEAAFDRMTRIVARQLMVPIAWISFVDQYRVWFKSVWGLELSQIERSKSWCQQVIFQADTVMLPEILPGEWGDLGGDPTISPAFYAGVPLKTVDGWILGTLSVLDRIPRQLNSDQLTLLEEIAATVLDELELRLALRKARESEARLHTLVEQLPFEFWLRDVSGKCLMQNSTSIERWGNQIGQRPEASGLSPDLLATWQTSNQRALTGEVVQGEVQYHHQGRSHTFFNIVAPIWEAAQITGILGVNIDITERKRVEEALQESEAKFRTLAEMVPVGILIATGARIRYVNSAMSAITGYSREELLAMTFWYVMAPDSRDLMREQWLANQNAAFPSRYEMKILTKHGLQRWLDITTSSIEFAGHPATLGTAFDITDRKRVEEQLVYDAYHDPLTGIPNRALFQDRVGQAIRQAKRSKESLFGVLFIDLDHFKTINDTLGHLVGDQLLIAIAQRLRACLRPTDMVARLGGDEFAILMEKVKDIEDTIYVSDRILKTLAEPFYLDGHEVTISASIGVTLYRPDYNSPEDLLRDADLVMYHAKAAGRGCYKVFDPAMIAS
ncbi:diguanylate cyclase domain-containing protein [Neosynechococcus sphagnicola]|uniref:diguanylate cyclase domain-containing protein n=1 Tax=Neosynechococcus sphagnicola TaxID=1501145 RepID=UPI00068EE2C5|nr:diguanylate cyclase [Neosynechococcus sphagnicola]